MTLLVKFDKDWADEFSVYGMAIMSQENFDHLMKWAKNANWNFGSNEGWDDQDISDGFSATQIDEDDIRYLKDLVFEGRDTYGIFPDWQDMVYDEAYSRHEIVQDGGGWAVELDGTQIAFGFGQFDEANEWLHARLEKMLF